MVNVSDGYRYDLIVLEIVITIKPVVTVSMILDVGGVMIRQTPVLESVVKVASVLPGISVPVIVMMTKFCMKGGSSISVQV